MEPASRTAGAPEARAAGLIVGVGNTLCGDDGAGPVVARRVWELLPERENWDTLELCRSALDVIERLAGYRFAVIVDALVDWDAPAGTVVRVSVDESAGDPSAPSHALGFRDALALARAAGLPLPESIAFYGIVVRGPLVFGAKLSPAIEARIETIARQIVEDLARGEKTAGPVCSSNPSSDPGP
ncbi:MAG: hydrogenase maturation protease [Bryobacteraceae bacterium]